MTDANLAAVATRLELSLNGQQFSTARRELYAYHSLPEPLSIAPRSGPLSGGTRVLLNGRGLADASAFSRSCRFGENALVAASVVSARDGTIACVSPVAADVYSADVYMGLDLNHPDDLDHLEGSSLTVELSRYGEPSPVLFASLPSLVSRFKYTLGPLAPSNRTDEANSTALFMSPPNGPMRGGAPLALHLMSTDILPACHIPVSFYSSSRLFSSLTHPFPTWHTPFFLYTRLVVFLFLDLNFTSLEYLGTTLAFNASDLLSGPEGAGGNNSERRCRFDVSKLQWPTLVEPPPLVVEASVHVGTGVLKCVSPAVELTFRQLAAGNGAPLPVSVSLNAQQYVTQAQLALYETPRLDLVSPRCGPIDGGTAVTLVGDHFSGVGPFAACQFGEGSSVAASYERTRYGDLVHCSTPPVELNDASRRHLVVETALSLNGQQFEHAPAGSHDGSFTFYDDPPAPTKVMPSSGAAGTLVTLYGVGWENGCVYKCLFVGAPPVDASYNPGRGMLQCRVPVLDASALNASEGGAAVWISLNGQQFINTHTHFRVDESVT